MISNTKNYIKLIIKPQLVFSVCLILFLLKMQNEQVLMWTSIPTFHRCVSYVHLLYCRR